jgi:uncharacterized membrane protein
MGTMTVVRFADAQAADRAVATFRDLQRQNGLPLQDAALVTWPSGSSGPAIAQPPNLISAGSFGSVWWSLLFGLVFFTPFFGITAGAAIGTLADIFAEYGIDDVFIGRIRLAVTEGTSALFLVTREPIANGFAAAIAGTAVDAFTSQLSTQRERSVRGALLH